MKSYPYWRIYFSRRDREIIIHCINHIAIIIRNTVLVLIFSILYGCSSVSILIDSNPSAQIPSEIEIKTVASTCIKNPYINYFMYHYVRSHDPRDNASTRDLSIDPSDFRKHMSYIRNQADTKSITLMRGVDFIASIKSGCFPGNHIWIFTSDDGWSDTYDQLVPIAREYQIPFFLGIITDRIDTPWFVTHNQVLEISRDPLYTISSHSINHREQDTMPESEEKDTVCNSKSILETLIQKPVESYIYPVWKMSKYSKQISQQCGYQIAWSTGFGTNWDSKNPSKYDINRIRIHSTTTVELFRRMINEVK